MRLEPAQDRDLPAIEAYLSQRAATSMFLRSNLRAAGLRWSGGRWEAEYVVGSDSDSDSDEPLHWVDQEAPWVGTRLAWLAGPDMSNRWAGVSMVGRVSRPDRAHLHATPAPPPKESRCSPYYLC